MDIVLSRKLGEGAGGATFLTKFNGVNCIYKIEKYDKNDKASRGLYKRLLYFNNDVAVKHPDKFMTLVAHGIIEKCDHTHNIPVWASGHFRQQLVAKNKLSGCIFLIYSPAYKSTLSEIKLSEQEYYRCCYQIAEQLKIISDAGYIHRDIHKKNVMQGYDGNFHVIDYDAVFNKNFSATPAYTRIKRADNHDEHIDFLWYLDEIVVDDTEWQEYLKKKRLSMPSLAVFKQRAQNSAYFQQLLKLMPKETPKDLTNWIARDITLLEILFRISYPNEYYRLCNIREWETLPPMFATYNPQMVIYLIKNFENWKKALTVTKSAMLSSARKGSSVRKGSSHKEAPHKSQHSRVVTNS